MADFHNMSDNVPHSSGPKRPGILSSLLNMRYIGSHDNIYQEPRPETRMGRLISNIFIYGVGVPITIFFYASVILLVAVPICLAAITGINYVTKPRDAISDIRMGEEAIRNAAVECVRNEKTAVTNYGVYSGIGHCMNEEAAALEELRVSVAYLVGVERVEKSKKLGDATAPLVEGVPGSGKECAEVAKAEMECKRIERETLAMLDPAKNSGCMMRKINDYWADCNEFSELRLGFRNRSKRPASTFYFQSRFDFRGNLPTVVQRHFGQDKQRLTLF